jgi:cell pole-organizing protein PopZ
MAQANNSAQREPSMEEILASIRRIIEDSDTQRQQTDETVAAAAEDTPSARTGSVIEVESFRADLRASAEAHQAEKAQSAPPVSLADIQAEVRAARPSFAEEAKSEPFKAEPDLPKAEMSAVEEALTGAADESDLDQDEMIAELSEQLGTLKTSGLKEPTDEPKPAILSEHAGRQVAASFGELTEAFSSNRRRSFEEIAEEMMRPMLQDWLDNNLPVLVERLVREEIERVARG